MPPTPSVISLLGGSFLNSKPISIPKNARTQPNTSSPPPLQCSVPLSFLENKNYGRFLKLQNGKRAISRKCRAMVSQTSQGPSAAYAKEMERLGAKESLLLALSRSPYLEGKWKFEWFGSGSPGLLAARLCSSGTFQRLFLISCLDDEIMIARSTAGVPEVLTRLDPGPPVVVELIFEYES